MKRVFITAMSLALLVACNSGGEKTETKPEEKTEEKAAETDVTQTPEYQDGLGPPTTKLLHVRQPIT